MTRAFDGLSHTPTEYYNRKVASKPHHVVHMHTTFSSEAKSKKPKTYSAHRQKCQMVEDDYFFRAMGPIIRFGQLITLMPIVNCLDANRQKIKFKWLSFQTFKTIIGLSCTLLDLILLLKLVRHVPKFSINIIWAVVFDICGCLCHILLFRVAMNWHRLIREWTWREKCMLRPPYKKLKYSLKFKLRMIAFLVVLGAVVEHNLFLSQIMYPLYKRNEICGDNQNIFEQVYFGLKIHYAVVFDYSIYMLLLTEWINFTMTISWTYVDVLIITMCIAISNRFEQINSRMRWLKVMPFDERVWNETREQYMKLSEIITYIDRYMGLAIMLSCASNMYFICQQLYNSVKIDFAFPINRIYFWYSLTFVVVKTCTVLFSASRINDVSMESITILRHMSLSVWSVEIDRFMEYLFSDMISLSGLNYFNVTRRFMFAMVGTIITYEILLFDQLVIKRGTPSNICT